MALSNSARRAVGQTAVLIALALAAGAIRQTMPRGISWKGRWPTSDTTAGDAYKMMSQPGDPPFVPVGEAIALHKAGVRFLDARDAKEYAGGHIPGARSLPFYDFDAKQAAALDGAAKSDPIVVYCEGVGCELSLFLGRQLEGLGYTGVKVFYGGFPEWKNAGLPVEK